jgi:hypothetical protein
VTRLLALAAVLAGLALCGAAQSAVAMSKQFTPGVVSGPYDPRSAKATRMLGARVVRVEFAIGTPASALRHTVAAIARQGARPLLLAGFHGRMPTEGEARNLAGWAREFGAGGRFWKHRRPARRKPVRLIEFGNETSYSYQYGDTYGDPSYAARAELYATRFAQARAAIKATHRGVGLLAQADDGGSGSRAWVGHMFAAVPRLDHMVAGWTAHPYGPRWRWEAKLHALVRQTAAHGSSRRIPIDVTEYGIATDDGHQLFGPSDGWPVDETYTEAAAALRSAVAGMRSDPAIGPRLRLFLIYRVYDLQPPGASGDREHYFGALRHDLAGKGAYTAEVRRLLRR